MKVRPNVSRDIPELIWFAQLMKSVQAIHFGLKQYLLCVDQLDGLAPVRPYIIGGRILLACLDSLKFIRTMISGLSRLC